MSGDATDERVLVLHRLQSESHRNAMLRRPALLRIFRVDVHAAARLPSPVMLFLLRRLVRRAEPKCCSS